MFGFFLLAYAISWVLWAPAVLASLGWIDHAPSRYLHLAGGLGPMLAAIFVSARGGGRAAVARLGKSCVSGRSWLLLAVLIPAALFLLATAIIAAFQRVDIEWTSVGRSTEFPEFPRPVYWLANIVFYGIGEEVGWRGFALPRLQTSVSALRASLLLAVGWAGWHLPLFVFSPGLSSMGAVGAIGWLYPFGESRG